MSLYSLTSFEAIAIMLQVFFFKERRVDIGICALDLMHIPSCVRQLKPTLHECVDLTIVTLSMTCDGNGHVAILNSPCCLRLFDSCNKLVWSAAQACLAVSPLEHCHNACLDLVSGQVDSGEGDGVGKVG